jgi:hypothetical protein
LKVAREKERVRRGTAAGKTEDEVRHFSLSSHFVEKIDLLSNPFSFLFFTLTLYSSETHINETTAWKCAFKQVRSRSRRLRRR